MRRQTRAEQIEKTRSELAQDTRDLEAIVAGKAPSVFCRRNQAELEERIGFLKRVLELEEAQATNAQGT